MKDGESRDPAEIAVSSLLEQGLADLGSPYDEGQLQKLLGLVSLLSEWAERINLTGHRDPLQIASRLVLDAAALSQALPELGSSSTLSDLGGGAGFPGLPIAILRPELEVRLVESRKKRHYFQREARRQLGLMHVIPLIGRSDQLDAHPSDIAIAQAMTRPEQALHLMLPWVRKGGLLALPASAEAVRPAAPESIPKLELREYTVPITKMRRRLWVGRLHPE